MALSARLEVIRDRGVKCQDSLRGHADSSTYLVDVLQRISMHPTKQAIKLTPRMWKSLFADAPLRSDLGPHDHDPPCADNPGPHDDDRRTPGHGMAFPVLGAVSVLFRHGSPTGTKWASSSVHFARAVSRAPARDGPGTTPRRKPGRPRRGAA